LPQEGTLLVGLPASLVLRSGIDCNLKVLFQKSTKWV
jgi:hypothetical protein